MTKIHIFVYGYVPNTFLSTVRNILSEFYTKVSSELPYVEVYVYGSSHGKVAFLESEAREIGVIAVGDFIVMHEAWRGWPRIHIDYEKCKSLDFEYLKALLLHEAAHSILHGSPLYYMISLSKEIVERFGFEEAAKLLYLASTIVKDFDVHRFLIEKGFRRYVELYLRFSLENWGNELRCDNIYELLNTVKVLASCMFIECDLNKVLPRDCVDAVSKAFDVIKHLDEVCREGDVDCKANTFLKGVFV